ncbi:MFS transporter [Streptomyces albiflaviniger]|nr:MFS transporter [Streptomyces albiflaviniger]
MVVAGPLVDVTGPAALFCLIAALALLALAGMVRATLPSAPCSPTGRVDLAGAALLASVLVTILLAISQGRAWGWSSPWIITLFAATVALSAAFGVVERHVAAPLVDLRLLIGPRLLTTNVATLVVSVGMFAAVTLLPLFVQTPTALGYGFGYSPARTGLVMAPVAVCMLLATPLAARVSSALGARAAFGAGAVLAAIALAGLGLLHEHIAAVLVWCAVLGLAYGLAFASLGGLVVGAVGREQTGAATGINTILRTVGGALGSALATVIVTSSATTLGQPPTESGYTTAFVVAGAIALCAAALAATRSTVTPQSRDPVDTTSTAPSSSAVD